MAPNLKTSIKYFPFSPGIPWKIKNGKYILPNLPMQCFYDILERDAVISGFGGILESFYSLTILETINRLNPTTKLFWCGNDIYKPIIESNRLASFFDEIDQYDLDRFPSPIFFDKNNRAYFNYLNNYLNVKSYWLGSGYTDKRPVIEQILEKSTVPWDIRHMPQFREIKRPDDLDYYLKIHRLHLNRKFVLLFPDGDEFSIHNNDCLNWDIRKIKEFAAFLHQKNIPLVLMTNNPTRYTYSKARVLPLRMDFLILFLKKASVVMSKKIDFLLIAAAISNAKLISKNQLGAYNLNTNMNFIDSSNDVHMDSDLEPIDVTNIISESDLL